jgi:hypothetical protein
MKLELNPETVASQIVAEADKKGHGLSSEHEEQLKFFIVEKLKSFEVKKAEKSVKE